MGTSLLELDRERPLFLFQCLRNGRRSAVGIVVNGRKVMGDEETLAAGEILGAYDLALDPGEHENLFDREDWPAELLRSAAAGLADALEPRFAARRAALHGQQLEDLQALGYIGDE